MKRRSSVNAGYISPELAYVKIETNEEWNSGLRDEFLTFQQREVERSGQVINLYPLYVVN